MILSMTGYGRAEGSYQKQAITVELKAVNSRYLDCSIRTGSLYVFLEEPVKNRIAQKVARGKLSVFITIDSTQADAVEITVNESALEGYMTVAKRVASLYNLQNDISVSRLLTLPDVLSAKRLEQDNDALQEAVLHTVDKALVAFNDMRRREGDNLAADLAARCTSIEALTAELETRSPQVVQAYRAKVEERMKELLGNDLFDPQRVIAEAALFADKVAINEELVRLRSHSQQLRAMLKSGGAIGRKLDFLIQEFNREANTIGSKANDASMAMLVVELKAEIEKIREQAQNIE